MSPGRLSPAARLSAAARQWFRPARRFVQALLLAGLPVTGSAAEPPQFDVSEFLQRHCVDCHGATTQKGERRFDRLDLAATDADTLFDLQDIIDQLTLETMPPEEADQPTAAERQAAIETLTNCLAEARQLERSTDRQTVLRRLNRREYLNTIGDLFAMNMVMFDPTTKFPRDNTVEHFDNVGDALVTSGYLLEQYLEAAEKIVAKAFAIDEPPEVREWVFRGHFRQQPELDPAHKEAFDFRYLCLYDSPLAERPEGAYGPLEEFAEGVPVDGTYEIRVLAQAMHRDTPYDEDLLKIDLDEPFRLGIVPGNAEAGSLHTIQPIQPLLAEQPIADGDPQWYTFRVPLDEGYTPRFTFENGFVEVRPTYGRVMRRYRDLLPERSRDAKGIFRERKALIRDGFLPHIRIHEVRIRGPIETPWPTATRRAVLGDGPFRPERTRPLLERFARRAYRRPVRPDELDRLMALVESRRADGRTPLEAYQDALKAVICSPAFLYLQPAGGSEPAEGSPTLSPYGLASRLSYFLWASMPDERLFRLAESGELASPEVLREEVRRMLADDRSRGMIEGFLDSWLNLRALGDMPPDRKAFTAYYADCLDVDMRSETQRFMRYLIEEDRPVTDFLTADYSFLNRDLAKLYGVSEAVPAEGGHRFRKVSFDDSRRGGLLGQASVLTVTANGIETSPVVRGVWLLENILGTPPPPPPDDVPAIDPDVRGATSIRDLLEKHRSSAACNECHRKIDPLGFAMESFDPIGQWRTRYDRDTPIDPSGKLPGGESFEDVAGLKEILGRRESLFARTLTEKLLTYAIGRPLEPLDRPAVEEIVGRIADEGYPTRTLIEAIVLSETFRRR